MSHEDEAPVQKYEWTYTGGAKRTPCPNCEEYVNTGKDVAELKKEDDPFDPMNAPTRPDMTKEEIFDVMAEKLIRNGEKITPGMRELMEMLAEKAAMELGRMVAKKVMGTRIRRRGNDVMRRVM